MTNDPPDSTMGGMALAGITCMASAGFSSSAEKESLSPLAIFHSTVMVGFTSPRSICPSMLLDTPVSLARASKLSLRSSRMARRLLATVPVTSMLPPENTLLTI